ncbi:FAD-dependent oxidoreductase [Streptomyces chengbuensis]|uniref:FAD-dependent oxidoreductase n=1 Tax=Streptomyces chengbuensis TaxID=3053466 RepID=UPI003F4D2B99
MTDEAFRAYDVIVIGAGPVGENVADRASAAGLTTVIVERELLGGECSFWACEPSKACCGPWWPAPTRRVPGLGDAVRGPPDVDAVLAHRDRRAAHCKDEDQVDWLDPVSVDLIRGHGRLTGPRVSVRTPDGDTARLTARHAVALCTGTGTALPDIPGLDAAAPWTNREATSAGRVPCRLVVVGAGVVAVELATAWQALGSQVTLLVRGDGLLTRREPFAGELVADGLREAGADIQLGTEVVSVERRPGGSGEEVRVTLTDGEELNTDEIPFATGRAPRTSARRPSASPPGTG